ncbi:MAG: imidazole glycerol phosphate synthase subunit HisH [Pyrinomonadaceae bacterium]|nr:imidazole glycerol phosphate synthase subunit HisH [Pyrinomonadaceae bacterium]MCX7639487.1 imidazole glycerol phosphate synthase subunit HisH [Pyrinomonadaceae bacterium]MDW8304462.1 imidazole glycerol phosphate synthase subunit HisH [Acidobacteriota bacterium]
MKVAIIKYNAGNTESVKNALERLGVKPVLTDSPEEIISADKVIFPGVGEASNAMRYLRQKNLEVVISSINKPFLGICLGMQLLCDFSEENETECLGIFPYKVRKFSSSNVKVPHIGWNQIFDLKGKLFSYVREGEFFYFVHSFYVDVGKDTTAICDYDVKFSAALERENFYAVQFHPEKSGSVGERLLRGFLEL